MRPIVTPQLDPLAHKAAIDALEAQRAAYRRYARTVEAQRTTLADGNGDAAAGVAEAAARDFDELEAGAARLQPLVSRVNDVGSADQLREMQRHMEELMRDAYHAETAIRNLATQLEAWRDAYGRQLAELGLPPGAAGEARSLGTVGVGGGYQDDGRRGPYVQPGFGRGAGRGRTTLIDKKG